MLQLYPVYLLCNRRKTLAGSPDPTRANGTNKPCIFLYFTVPNVLSPQDAGDTSDVSEISSKSIIKHILRALL